MDNFLDKFKKLPKELQEAVAREEKIRVLEEIEKKFGLKLVKIVVRVMVKDILWPDLEKFLVENFKLAPEKATELKKDLAEKIFNEVMDYLSKDLRLQVKDLSLPPAAVKYTPFGSEIDRNIPRPVVGVKLVETEKLEEKLEVDEDIKKRFESGAILPAFKKIEPPFVPQRGTAEDKKPIEIDRNMPRPVVGAKYTPSGSEIDRNLLRPVVGTKLTEKEEIPLQVRRPISEERITEDINIRPRAIGPVEELSQISLIDLQRWGGSEKTAQIILDKINLLKELSLEKMAEGIRAWQKSPLYRLYLTIGQEALEEHQSVGQIIRKREREGKIFLTTEDFEAMSELNKKLRF